MNRKDVYDKIYLVDSAYFDARNAIYDYVNEKFREDLVFNREFRPTVVSSVGKTVTVHKLVVTERKQLRFVSGTGKIYCDCDVDYDTAEMFNAVVYVEEYGSSAENIFKRIWKRLKR